MTVTSNDGCVGVMNVAIVEPSPIQVTPSIVSNISNAGACDGVLVGTATRGTPGYVYNWMDCITQFSLGNQTTIENLCAGDYAFQVTDMNGCTATSSCVNLSTTSGIVENQTSTTFSIFPNPSNGLVTIINNDQEMPFEVTVLDINGRIVYNNQFVTINNTIELDQTLSNGLYTVIVKSEVNVSASKLMILK